MDGNLVSIADHFKVFVYNLAKPKEKEIIIHQ
jgi:hypothetical protein